MIEIAFEDRRYRAPVDNLLAMEMHTGKEWVPYTGDVIRVLMEGSMTEADRDALQAFASSRAYEARVAAAVDGGDGR